MTTVVGYAAPGGVWIAADEMTNVYDRPVLGCRKVRQMPTTHAGPFLLGYSGDGAIGSVMARHLTVASLPDTDDDTDCDAWANTVASAITDICVEHQLVDDGHLDGNLLLGIPGHLWTITHHQAITHPDGVSAIGSGEGPAMGALRALLGRQVPPGDAVLEACENGIHFDRFSGGTPIIEHLTDD